MTHTKRRIFGLIAALLVLLASAIAFLPDRVPEPRERRLELVAHAGGTVSGYVYSNALEALQNSVSHGYRYIELDFMPTSDGRIVLTHVWNNMPYRVPGAPDHIVTHAEFMALRLFNRYTPMDLEMLITFLAEHPDIRIITDTKDGYDAYAALYVIVEQFPDYIPRFIPQAYRFAHVERIRALGFQDVIVTLYLYPEAFFDDPAEIARLAREHAVYAVTIQEYGIDPDYAARLDVANIRFFAHTVNNPYRAQELWDMGFTGIYTQFLIPEEGPVPVTWGLAPCQEGEIARLEANIARLSLSSDEASLLSHMLIFRLDTPIYIDRGAPYAMGQGSDPVTPVAHHATGVIYLPWGAPYTAVEAFEAMSFHVLHIGDFVFVTSVSSMFAGLREEALLTLAERIFD